MPERANARWARWLLLSAAVVALDLATKAWVSAVFAPGEGHDVTSFLRLVLVYNTGAAFSLLADAGGWDRLTLGHVVDFVLLHAGRYAWPAFNVADSAITVGVVVLVWESVWPRGRPRRIEREEA
jgi:signal peptidase II